MKIEFAETPVVNDFSIFLPYTPDRDDHYTRGVASGGWQLEESLIFIKKFFANVAAPGRSFIDVGANCGIYTLVVGSLGMPVIAIEALPDNYMLLFAGIRKNGFRNIRPVMAAATNRNDVLMIDGTSAWASISHTGQPVPGIRLDDLLAISDFSCPALIKVDVEGHELQVIEGAIETISQYRDVDFVIEIFPGHEHSLRFLEERGYNCYMLKQNGMIPTHSTDFIECQVTDFYCTRRAITSSTFADTPVLVRDAALSIAMLTGEAREHAVAHRIAIARRLKDAPPHLTDLPQVQGLLNELQADPDEHVRQAVNAWRK